MATPSTRKSDKFQVEAPVMKVIHRVIVPTYLILNQLVGVVEVHTVKSQGGED